MIGYREGGDSEVRGAAGTGEDEVKLVAGFVSRRRRREGQIE